jgi:FAD dependent oxidoreductase
MNKILIFLLFSLLINFSLSAHSHLFIEAESFKNKGGWLVDQQFMDIMGSPYLIAHGLGKPVNDASTKITFPKKGKYYVYVRTFNWTSPWNSGEGPGKFNLSVGTVKFSKTLGNTNNKWFWEKAGEVKVENLETTVTLHDLSGFDGRCDAIYFTTDTLDTPPSDKKTLDLFRKKMLNLPLTPKSGGKYDFIVIGGGTAGICASLSAARLGLKVALIQDRPILGGNNSSDVRVHLGGQIEQYPYPKLGNLIKEFGPTKGGNAQPADYYEDQKKENLIKSEKNISLFCNYHAIAVKMNGNKITAVIAKNTENSTELSFEAPLFADCTGDGTIGFLAKADFKMGRESKSEYNEMSATENADNLTMGSSVQWYSVENSTTTNFPRFQYGIEFNDKTVEKIMKGDWNWETGMNFNQISDLEYIRDYGLAVVYSNWSYLKNNLNLNEFKNRDLAWVAYIAGKRESRRLLGDYILTETDIKNRKQFEDACVTTTWSIDLHYPDPNNTQNFPNKEFKSIAKQDKIKPFAIPYRCFYSRNIDNLFMAGRDISVTHIALGTIRVMRTTGMAGEVVGMAASLCKKKNCNPRNIYSKYFDDLKHLMAKGTGKELPNNQKYNGSY